MNKSQIWAILECVLLLSQDQTQEQLIKDFGFLPVIVKSALKLYIHLKSFELIGNPFVNLIKRQCPTAESLEIKFDKIKPGDLK